MKKIIMYSLGIAGIAAAGLVAVPSLAQAQSANNNRGDDVVRGYQQVMHVEAAPHVMTEDTTMHQASNPDNNSAVHNVVHSAPQQSVGHDTQHHGMHE